MEKTERRSATQETDRADAGEEAGQKTDRRTVQEKAEKIHPI